MKKTRSLVLALALVLALMLALTGCGGKSASSSRRRSNDDEDRNPTIEVSIENSSGYKLYQVFISPSSSSSWGDDLLNGDILRPGNSTDLTVEGEEGDYDIRFVDEEYDESWFYSIPLEGGSSMTFQYLDGDPVIDLYNARGDMVDSFVGELVYSDDGNGDTDEGIEIYFENTTQETFLSELYIFEDESTDTGSNLVDSFGGLAPGEGITYRIYYYERYSIGLMDDNGNNWVILGVYLEEGCSVYVTSHNGIGITVECADGSSAEYH